ncbi:MAG TPA: BlaI/MecI/CopY family transcriptional regulator [Gemmatimonadaceae bacterium]|nr:BlaI/MecI/CopY family transcriptional regulator [Gemmatimonadaceae bacterium]
MDDVVLGDRELDVMGVLWEMRSGTVAEVRDALEVELAYTTVLTILRNLEAKGFVTHQAEGRAHRYAPLLARSQVRSSAVSRLIDTLFHGSPEQLLAHLVENRTLSARDFQRLRTHLAADASAPPRGRSGGKDRSGSKGSGGSGRRGATGRARREREEP